MMNTDEVVYETEEIQETSHAQEERVLTEFEQEQVKNGWNPKGEKTAEEWANNTPLFEKIKKQSRQLKTLNRTIDQLKTFMQKQEEAAYQRAVADLTAQREQAVLNGDKHEVERLDKEAQAIKPIPQEALDFHERNASWLKSPKPLEMKMTAFARQRDADLMQYGLSPAEHMKVLEEHVRAEFPDYFRNREVDEDDEAPQAPVVSSGRNSNVAGKVTGKKKFTYNDLNPAQKKIANDFKHANIMTIDKYIEALVKNGELK